MAKDLPAHLADSPPGPSERRRRVSVAGVSGGVGTTTLATAIDGIDRGVFVGRPVDVLVCRGTAESLQRAGQAAQLQTDSTGRRPLLAVTATDPSGLSRGVAARLRLTSAYTSRVVTVPLVRRWRDSTTHLRDARSTLAGQPAELPRALRGFARAIHDIRQHLDVRAPHDQAYRTPRPRDVAARSVERGR